jgi:RNA polymerase sigma-70 factor (sigma-E family)
MSDQRDEEFTAFVATRRARLLHTAYLLTGDWQRAEDVVQTALTKLYIAWPRVMHDGNVDAFARKIVVNCHTDERRRPWRRERSALDGFDPPAAPSGSTEDRDALMQALAQLPPRQRRTVVLRYFAELSVEETATDLGCSTGTVKSQTNAALRKLDALLSPTFDDTTTHRTGERHG